MAACGPGCIMADQRGYWILDHGSRPGVLKKNDARVIGGYSDRRLEPKKSSLWRAGFGSELIREEGGPHSTNALGDFRSRSLYLHIRKSCLCG